MLELNCAEPFATAAEPRMELPSAKVTVPVGDPLPAPETVAVNVIAAPCGAEVGFADSDVVVDAGP